METLVILPENYTYHQPPAELMADEISFRVKEVVDEDSAKAWLKTLCAKTFITWRIARTYPASSRVNIYKVDLRCQHLSYKKVKDLERSKNTNCPAKLFITVKRFVKNSRSKNVDQLTEEWPCVVHFKGTHNHEIYAEAALKHRDLCDDSKEKLLALFQRGHSTLSALLLLKTELLLEYDDHYFKICADSYYVPSNSVTYKLFHKRFSIDNKETSEIDMFESLESILDEYNQDTKDGHAKFQRTSDGKNYFVVICTPIMSRAHEKLRQSKELVLVDAISGGLKRQNHCIYFFTTPTAAGGVPLGIIVTDTEITEVFTEAVKCLQEIFPSSAFYGKGFPAVFMTDNDLKERKPLENLFPESRLLLSQFQVSKAVWAWLVDTANKIEKIDRQELYFLFKNILYAENENEAEEQFEFFCLSKTAQKYIGYIQYIEKMWRDREDWASYCCCQLPLRDGNSTISYVDIVFRILEECIFDKIMKFNLSQIVDFILNRYERYMEKRLIDFVNGKYSKCILREMLPEDKNNSSYHIITCHESPGYFQVKSQEDANVVYDVDITAGFCSCYFGQCGKICKHASAILLWLEKEVISSYNLVSNSKKEVIYFVATGSSLATSWWDCFQISLNEKNMVKVEAESANELDQLEMENVSDNSTTASDDLQEELSQKELLEINQLFVKMQDGISNNPSLFVPAARKMISNYKKFAQSDDGLISAMYTFGLPPKKYSTKIGVKSTTKRKLALLSKTKNAGCDTSSKQFKRKEMDDHDYTTFGALPSKKKEDPM